MGEGLNLPEEFYDLPLSVLGPSTRRLLSIHLDPPAVIPTPTGILGDLSGLAELAGFEFCHIRYFDTKHSRTFACLEEWQSRPSGTIGNLLKSLITMERFDCISEIKDSILRDIQNHAIRLKENTTKKHNNDVDTKNVIPKDFSNSNSFRGIISHLQDEEDICKTDSGFDSRSFYLSEDEDENTLPPQEDNSETLIKAKKRREIEKKDINVIEKTSMKARNVIEKTSMKARPASPVYEEDGFLTTHDSEGQLKNYTACICCADENLDLANSIIENYKQEENADFFLPQEALLGGRYEFETLAEVIETRCDSRVLVILSKYYLTSPACVFATQFVKTLDPAAKCRKIIPILLDEDLPYPRVLRGISSIKARRLKFGNGFWNLLSSSLRLKKLTDDQNNIIKNNTLDMNNLDENGRKCQRKNAVHQIDHTKPDISEGFSLEASPLSEVQEETLLDDGIGATSTFQSEEKLNDASGAVTKKKNPGLKTLRRIMKSLNIMEKKPKLQYTKRSHSTSETLPKPPPVLVEPRSYSTNVPPVLTSSASYSEGCSKQEYNICHTESEVTLKNLSDTMSVSESGNDLSKGSTSAIRRCSSSNAGDNSTNTSENTQNGITSQNILSPNIRPLLVKDTSFDKNDLNSLSRHISYDQNITWKTKQSSFDNMSMLSEITSSDNNSIISRKMSFDNCSNASSFHQMPLGSRQTSFDSNNSRQTSFDGNSMTSVEDNMAADKYVNKSCMNENVGIRKKSEVMFEIML